MTAVDLGIDQGVAAAEKAYRDAQTLLLWRRRLLPAAGIVAALGLWAFIVWFFKVPVFVAPSPQLVLMTLWTKLDILLANLLPTAIEAF